MTETAESEPSAGGSSRRNVLKAGVAVGVGAVAWSGPTITSLGGTPAYATVCTQPAEIFDLIQETNTNSSCKSTKDGVEYTYLTFQKNLDVTVPAKYNLSTNFLDACADEPVAITFTNPANPPERCQLQFVIGDNNDPNPLVVTSPPSAAGSTGTLMTPVINKAQDNPNDPNADRIVSANGRYSLTLVCIPDDGACFPNGQPF